MSILIKRDEKWKSNITSIYTMLRGMTKLFITYYQGIYKVNLDNYFKFIDHVKNLSDIEKIEVLNYQITELISFYYSNQDNIDKVRMKFMCDSDFCLYVRPEGKAFIPLTDCYMEALLKENNEVNCKNLVNNVDGCLYTLIYNCLDVHSPAFINTYNKYTPNRPILNNSIRTDTVSNSIEDVITKLSSKITINDPVLESKVSSMADTLKNTLIKVAENSVSELEKEGMSDIKDKNGNIVMSKMVKLIPRMLANSNIHKTLSSAIDELGNTNIDKMMEEVIMS